MIYSVPNRHYFSCGAAEGATRRNALDAAFHAGGLGYVNLVAGIAVVPPQSRFEASCRLPEGALVPAAGAVITSDLPGEVISAAVAVAYPVDRSRPALIMDYSGQGHKEDIEAIVRRMAQDGLSTRGLEVREIRSIAVQHRVEKTGGVFAAVVLWNEP